MDNTWAPLATTLTSLVTTWKLQGQHLGISDYCRSVPLTCGQHIAIFKKKSQLSSFFTFPFSFISFSILLSE